MKSIGIGIAAALLAIATDQAAAAPGLDPKSGIGEKWKSLITAAPVKRDSQGQLLPLQSYDETIRRGMSFLLDDHLKWFKGPPETLL